MSRGTLRVYLGAAPGVGKTHAMLDEGWRRHQRGAAVFIGLVETHGRVHTESQIRDLPIVDRVDGELDVDGVIARHPQLVLVDDLAHRNAPGAATVRRWQDVDLLLDAGIDVIGTLDIARLESLHDVVERITGVDLEETIPDAWVRGAAQIELVDMSPEALRRRLAHGNIYPADQVDAALADFFRPGNLGALRELALLWVADRVEEQLHRYLEDHGVTESWETRERIVVAMTGAPGSDHLVRRAARMAGRVQGDLIGVHVRPIDPTRRPATHLDAHRKLLLQLGGTYREVVGDDVVEALATFASAERATQLVVGASGRESDGALRRAIDRLRGGRGTSLIGSLLRRLDHVDIHVIASAPTPRTAPVTLARPPMRSSLPRGRITLAWVVCLAGLPVLVVVLTHFRHHITPGSVMLLCLGLVVAVAAIGGLVVGLVASLLAFMLTNWYFVPPYHTMTVSDASNIVMLAVFVAVASFVSALVNRSADRSREALRARSEATALARTTGMLVGAEDPLPELVEQVRATFGLTCAAILERGGHVWDVAVSSGRPVPTKPSDGLAYPLDPDGDVQLVVLGGELRPDDQRVLLAFAGQLSLALESRRLRSEAGVADSLAQSNALRAALLQAVSHDLRTPLASIKASVSGLLGSDVEFSTEDRDFLLHNVDDAADRLDRMVANLLDMSRLQADAVELHLRPVALEDVVAAALAATPQSAGRVLVDVADDLPLVRADAGLLERALANLVSNALAWSPIEEPVRLQAGRVGSGVVLRVVDRGPGFPAADRTRLFEPFQRLGDRSSDAGVGLGLAVARGFVVAMGGSLQADDTPGGGATLSIVLPVADHLAVSS
jgi:two-component system sensor histidine kinase KdpD